MSRSLTALKGLALSIAGMVTFGPLGCAMQATQQGRSPSDCRADECRRLAHDERVRTADRAAVFVAEGLRPPSEPDSAPGLLERACVTGDGHGCLELAGMLDKGDGIARDRTLALTMYKRACAEGVEDGCDEAEHLARRSPEALAAGAVGASLGGAALIAGSLVYVHGSLVRGGCERANCKGSRDEQTIGGALMIAGGVLVVAGLPLVFYGAPKVRKSTRPGDMEVAVGPGSAGIHGAF